MTHTVHQFHRRSIRLKGYDYTQPGAYFVTLVTYQREEIFGKIVNGEMKLTPLGQIVLEEWQHSAEIRKEIRLYADEFVIMPNHLHGIVWIMPPVGADGVRPGFVVRPQDTGAYHDAPLHESESMDEEYDRVTPSKTGASGASQSEDEIQSTKKGAYHAPLHRVPRSLGAFIAGFKASVTSRAKRELDMTGIWQRNYYDHIIRNEKDFQAIWRYIDNNPLKWESDQLHPLAQPNRFNQV